MMTEAVAGIRRVQAGSHEVNFSAVLPLPFVSAFCVQRHCLSAALPVPFVSKDAAFRLCFRYLSCPKTLPFGCASAAFRVLEP